VRGAVVRRRPPRGTNGNVPVALAVAGRGPSVSDPKWCLRRYGWGRATKKKAFFKYKKRAQSRRDTAPPTGFGTRCFRRKRRGSRPYFCHVPANFGGAQHTTAAFMCVHALGTRIISWHMHTLEHYLIAHAGGASSLSAPATSLKRKLSCISRFSDQAATPSS
jgi:hypothetical protein